MKQFRLWLFLLVAGISLSASAATRTEPAMPAAVTLQDGGSYCLYNIGSRNFLYLYNPGYDDTAFAPSDFHPVRITATANGFTIQKADDGRYLSSYNGKARLSDRVCPFNITEGPDKTYRIQEKNKSSEYYGHSEGNTVYSNLTEGSIDWKFFTTEAGTRYCAELRLYYALEAMDGSNYNLDAYETMYADRSHNSPEKLNETAAILERAREIQTRYVFPDYNEYPILLQPVTNGWATTDWDKCVSCYNTKNKTEILQGTVLTEQDATLMYRINSLSETSNEGTRLEIYIDKKLVRTIDNTRQMHWNRRYYEEVGPGRHEIEWRYVSPQQQKNYNAGVAVYEVAVMGTPLIDVHLLEPGSLGTEVLYNTDHVKNVRRLRIAGKMNADDWSIIEMMPDLFSLDLSEASYTEIKNDQFSSRDKFPYFHAIKLPKDLKRIGRSAFRECGLDEIELPASLQTIDNDAFYGNFLEECILPRSVTSLGTSILADNRYLVKASLPEGIPSVRWHTFSDCIALQHAGIPESVKTIEDGAFSGCRSLRIPRLPKMLNTIESSAFRYCQATDSLILPDKLKFIGSSAFSNGGFKYAELPMEIYNLDNSSDCMFDGCHQLETLVLKSPTQVTGDNRNRLLNNCDVSKVTLRVPSFLVNSYKLDPVWYNYGKIEGFSTADIREWTLKSDLVLNARDRFEGCPDMTIDGTGSLKVNGDAAMTFNNFVLVTDGNNENNISCMMSKCENLFIKGDCMLHLDIPDDYRALNTWRFVCLPFNIKVADITNDNGAQFAIRYYDGAARAELGTGASWKNCDTGDIIPAGTGFIIMSSKAARYTFKAQDDASKQYVVTYKEFAKALQEHPSEVSANRGWNLVGNPYQTFYNIHCLNFTAPITLWDFDKGTYTAYSVIDDDVALKPNQAFFVQCPGKDAEISFPLDGRQLTSVIESQNGTRPMQGKNANGTLRHLIDLKLIQDNLTDRTRVVLNEEASATYEPDCDAAKFMSDDAAVPQLYTLDNEAVRYAINERPETGDAVRLGLYAAHGGAFTLTLDRCAAGVRVLLTDHLNAITTDLSAGGYHFTAEAGTDDARFTLSFAVTGTTGIENATADAAEAYALSGGIRTTGAAEIFSPDGRLAACTDRAGTVSLPEGVYMVRTAGRTIKVSVKQ